MGKNIAVIDMPGRNGTEEKDSLALSPPWET